MSQFPMDTAAGTAEPPSAPRRSLRTAVGLGIVLLAVGVTLALWASRTVRHEPVGPFAYGLHLFIPVRGETSEPAPKEPAAGAGEAQDAPSESPAEPSDTAAPPETSAPAEPASEASQAPPPDGPQTIEVQADYKALGPEDLSAVAEALEGVDADGPLLVRWTDLVIWSPARMFSPPRAGALAIVADAEADRWLDPLLPPADRGAEAYIGAPESLKDILAGTRFAEGAEGLKSAHLPAGAAVLEGMVLLRREAAEKIGLAVADAEPNVAILALRQPGAIEDAMRRLLPLWEARGLWMHPVDLRIARDSGARWAGLAALAAMLAGGALLVGACIRRLGACAEGSRPSRILLVGAARLASQRPAVHMVAGALVVAAIVGGAAVGWPRGLVPACAGGGDAVGLPAEPLAPAAVGILLVSLVADRFMRLGFLMGLPALVPGVGWLILLGEQVLGGMGLRPETLVLLDYLPLRAGVAALEVQAAMLILVGAGEVWRGVVRPASLGCESLRAGYVEGVRRLGRLLALAMVIAGAAALVEAIFIVAVAQFG